MGDELGLTTSAFAPSNDVRSAEDTFAHEVYHELGGKIDLKKIQELEDSGMLAQIPRNDEGQLTSVGSIDHEAGTCMPCAFWFKGICRKTIDCQYCHMVHVGQKGKRMRPSKQARVRYRRQEAALQGVRIENPD